MRHTSRLIFGAVLAVAGVAFLGCDSKDDKGTVTPSDASAQAHSDAAKDKMSNAGDALKDAGSSIKDAARQTGGAVADSARSMKDKIDASTAPTTGPSAHVEVQVAPPTTAP